MDRDRDRDKDKDMDRHRDRDTDTDRDMDTDKDMDTDRDMVMSPSSQLKNQLKNFVIVFHVKPPYGDISIPDAYCTVRPCTVQRLYATTRYRGLV
jgi:hypothetical protein